MYGDVLAINDESARLNGFLVGQDGIFENIVFVVAEEDVACAGFPGVERDGVVELAFFELSADMEVTIFIL